jgi:predicted amidohydrolase YtcJ
MGTALASGRQDDLGSLSPGKMADLIVLDQDIFTIDTMEISQIRPEMTIFNGQVVYEG